MAAICLTIGVMVGYLVRGSAPAAVPAQAAAASARPSPPGMGVGMGQKQKMPTLEQMKTMADKQAAPLLEKIKADPNNADLLNQAGTFYRMAHQFKDAEGFYRKSLEINPKNVGARTDLSSCLYYTGDVDGALAELNRALTYDPTHAGTLFNIGMIKWKGKNDAEGAVGSWQKLLKLNPKYENKEVVEKLIAQAKLQEKGMTVQQ
jgi:cytochrome c-type biogenesis protein CcmH/NrfG